MWGIQCSKNTQENEPLLEPAASPQKQQEKTSFNVAVQTRDVGESLNLTVNKIISNFEFTTTDIDKIMEKLQSVEYEIQIK